MKSTRVYLIVVLTLALLGTGGYAWRQHLQLASIQGPAKATKDMSAMEKRLWDAEQKARELAAELAAAKAALEAAEQQQQQRGGRGGPGGFAANAEGGRGAGGPGGGGRGANPQQALQQVLNRPEYQQAAAIQQKTQIDLQYAGLVRTLGLPADQADRVKSLIFDRDTAMADATAAAQSARLNPQSPEYQQFIDQALSTANENLRGSLGDTGYAALQNYEQTQNQRSVVNSFQQQLLSYGTGALLSDAQSEQLTQLLANSRGARAGAAPTVVLDQAFAFGGRGGGGGGAVVQTFVASAGLGGIAAPMQQISPNVLAQAQQILSPVQYQALQQMQKAQQAQQTMMQLTTSAMRDAQQQQQEGRQGAQQQRGGGQQQGAQPARAGRGARGQ